MQKVTRIVNVTKLEKLKKPSPVFETSACFFLFSLCLFCLYYFSFRPSTIIRIIRTNGGISIRRQRLINYDFDNMAKSRYDTIFNFLRSYCLWRCPRVTVSNFDMQGTSWYIYIPLIFVKFKHVGDDTDLSD